MARRNDTATAALDIRLIILNLDGVLSDGHFFIGEETNEWHSLYMKDTIGIKLLLKAGFEIAILSQRQAKSLEKRFAQLGIRHIFSQVSDSLAVYEELLKRLSLSPEQSAILASDIYDLPLLSKVALPACVSDAVPVVRHHAIWQSDYSGGHGAVRQFAEFILTSQGKLDEMISKLNGYEEKN